VVGLETIVWRRGVFLQREQVELAADVDHGRVDALEGHGQRLPDLEDVVNELAAARGVEPGELAQGVLDLLAVPELAGAAQVVQVTPLGDAFDERPEAGKRVVR